MKLVTIISEPILENELVTLVTEAGARGYSVGKVHGEGMRAGRTGDLSGPNIRLESVVKKEVAEKILSVLANEYFPRNALIAFVSDVDVVRGDSEF